MPEESNMQKVHIAGSDKPVVFYNLDVIISVGYRVKSQRGTQFRIWATNRPRMAFLRARKRAAKRADVSPVSLEAAPPLTAPRRARTSARCR